MYFYQPKTVNYQLTGQLPANENTVTELDILMPPNLHHLTPCFLEAAIYDHDTVAGSEWRMSIVEQRNRLFHTLSQGP